MLHNPLQEEIDRIEVVFKVFDGCLKRKHLTNPRLTGQTIALSRTGKYALLRNKDKKKE